MVVRVDRASNASARETMHLCSFAISFLLRHGLRSHDLDLHCTALYLVQFAFTSLRSMQMYVDRADDAPIIASMHAGLAELSFKVSECMREAQL